MSFFISSRVILPEDDPFTVFKKKVILNATAAMILINWWAINFTLFDRSEKFYACFPGAAVSVGAYVHLVYTKRVNDLIIEVVLYVAAVALVLGDLVASVVAFQSRLWALFVILTDIALVCRLPPRVTRILIATASIYFFASAIEATFRFGLFDWSYLPPQRTRMLHVTGCAQIPCKNVVAFTDLIVIQLAIFLLDFYFTRKFAYDLYAEKESMQRVITATEEIASSLSRFDLTLAESILNTAHLPLPLDTAFRDILSNLEIYRPYLPDAIFAKLHSECAKAGKQVPPPGLDTKKAALVFTDIQGSTATWEACPDGMGEGLKVHNEVMRECAAAHNGYEVKTIGDAFMVAFEEVSDAVQFSLDVLERLVKAQWPSTLLALEHCKWIPDGPWCGLRVRVGVHCGEVDVQLNTLTGRYDYFGNTVNKAARMEGACVGGAVAVTQEVLDQAGDLCGAIMIDMGAIELKGVQEAVQAYLLLPEGLAGRRGYVEEQMHLSRRDRKLKVRTQAPQQTASAIDSDSSLEMIQLDTMQRAPSATVGVAEVILESSDVGAIEVMMNSVLGKVVTSSERTHGTIVSLQGSRVAVCWNGLKTCVTHVENSLAFVQMMAVGSVVGRREVHVGVSTGSVVCGAVGGRRQKFVAVVGPCVGLSGTLCSRAESRKVLCCYAAPVVPTCLNNDNLGLRAVRDGDINAADGNVMKVVIVEHV
eukprot:TRINITY_DN417_c0_g1_i16.p1 TRINITY_DN417_c0_g1~~TRINITY_DN417_c0_g1_i16.p1  ORF type:complete len:705 (+),score=182.30 TRINITY_DN417_c0_g1_i16:54-2168(+)